MAAFSFLRLTLLAGMALATTASPTCLYRSESVDALTNIQTSLSNLPTLSSFPGLCQSPCQTLPMDLVTDPDLLPLWSSLSSLTSNLNYTSVVVDEIKAAQCDLASDVTHLGDDLSTVLLSNTAISTSLATTQVSLTAVQASLASQSLTLTGHSFSLNSIATQLNSTSVSVEEIKSAQCDLALILDDLSTTVSNIQTDLIARLTSIESKLDQLVAAI